MPRHAGRTLLAALAAASSIVLVANSALATGTTTLRTAAAGVALSVQSMAAEQDSVVTGWTEYLPSGEATFVRTTLDEGATWGPKMRLDPRPQRNLQLDVCDGWWWGASELHLSTDDPDLYSIYFQGHSLTDSTYSDGPILAEAGASDYLQTPDVACVGNRRTIVAWLEKDGSAPSHAKAEIDPLASRFPGPAVDYAVDLGPARLDGGITVAGSNTMAYAGWFKGDHFRFKRFSVGSGPHYAVTPHPTVTLFDATAAWQPVLAANGSTVVLAYTENQDLWVRISTNSGASFGPAHRLINLSSSDPNVAYARSVDVIGPVVLVEATEFFGLGGGDSHEYDFSSGDTGGSWDGGVIADHGERVGALAVVGDLTVTCEAWDQSHSSVTHQHLRASCP